MSVRVIRLVADGDVVADADRAQADDAVEGRHDRGLLQTRLREGDACLVRGELRRRLFESDLRPGSALDQGAGALEGVPRQTEIGLRLLDLVRRGSPHRARRVPVLP